MLEREGAGDRVARMTKRRDGRAAPPALPRHVDLATARKLISERYFPITAGTLRRELAKLPRLYVGRNALYDTIAVLEIAEGLLRRGTRRDRPGAAPVAVRQSS